MNEIDGVKYRVLHQRPAKGWRMKTIKGDMVSVPVPAVKGGKTVVEILDDEGNVLSIGYARCSDLDNYNKKLGRTIAFGRAKKALGS